MSRSKKDSNLFEEGTINEASMVAYLNNQLSAEEKQRFEKLLKEDPFAQEALEGLQSSKNEAAVSTALTSIHKKIRARTGLKEKKTFQIHWSNYAWAAVMLGLLIGIGFVLVNFVGRHDDNIAMNKEETESTGLFETQKEPVPVTVITDSIHTIQPLPTETTAAAPAKGKEALTQLLNVTDNVVTMKEGAGGKAQEGYSFTTTPSTATGSKVVVTDAAPPPATATKAKASEESNTDAVKSENMSRLAAPATQKVTRGAIVEREEIGNVTVITMEDAMKNFNSGNYKQSGEQFDAILQQQPANTDALYFGGISDYINGNTRKSEKNFDKLLKDGTKFTEGSKWYKANILIQKGKREEAKKLLDELAQSNGSYKERAIKKKAEIEF